MVGVPLSVRAQVMTPMDPVMRTAESITKIISFLLFRVPQKDKRKFLSRIRGKIIRLPAGQIGLKQMPPTASIGQSISLAKNILAGLNPFFVKRVLDEVGNSIYRIRDINFPAPPSLLPQVGKGRKGRPWGATSSLTPPLSKRALMDIVVDPADDDLDDLDYLDDLDDFFADLEQNLLEPTPSDLQFNTENQGYSSGPGSLTGNPYGILSIPVSNEGGGR